MSSPLIQNIENLQNILNTINELPEASSDIELPELTNPGKAADILSGKELIDGEGNIIIGTMPIVEQSTPSIEIDSTGLITASAIQNEGYVAEGSKNSTKQLTVQAAQTIVPGISDIVIDSDAYLTGVQTIKGDSNLVADNIKKGVSIFGVTGTHNGLNFEVVGGTEQPTNPKENTIWIQTESINQWVIAAENPYIEKVELITDNTSIDDGYYGITGTLPSFYEDSNWKVAYVSIPENTVSVTIPTREATSSSVGHWFYSEESKEYTFIYRDATNYTYDIPTGATSLQASIRFSDANSVIANVNNAVNGDVWIQTHPTTNFTEYNELEAGCFINNLLYAKQYIDGEWKTVRADIYKNGKWNRCAYYIYHNAQTAYSLNTKGMKATSSSATVATAPNIGVNASNFWAYNKKGTNGSGGIVYLNPKIDLTNLDTIYVNGTFTMDASTAFPYFGVWSSFGTYANENRGAGRSPCVSTGETTTGTYSLDVSSLKGEYYLGFCMSATSGTCSIAIWDIYGV